MSNNRDDDDDVWYAAFFGDRINNQSKNIRRLYHLLFEVWQSERTLKYVEDGKIPPLGNRPVGEIPEEEKSLRLMRATKTATHNREALSRVVVGYVREGDYASLKSLGQKLKVVMEKVEAHERQLKEGGAESAEFALNDYILTCDYVGERATLEGLREAINKRKKKEPLTDEQFRRLLERTGLSGLLEGKKRGPSPI